LDRLRMRQLELAVTVARRHRVVGKELVDAKGFADERGQRRQATQLKLALRFARFIGKKRSGSGNGRILVQKLHQDLERARRELAVGIEQEQIAPAGAGGYAIDAGRKTVVGSAANHFDILA